MRSEDFKPFSLGGGWYVTNGWHSSSFEFPDFAMGFGEAAGGTNTKPFACIFLDKGMMDGSGKGEE